MHPNDYTMLEDWSKELGRRIRATDTIGNLYNATRVAQWIEWLVLITKVLHRTY